MTSDIFTRHVRPIAVATGSLFAVAQLAVYLATRDGDLAQVATTGLYRWSCVLLLAGFVGLTFAAIALHARQAGRAGILGLVGLGGAVTGTVLMAGDWWFETFAVPFYAETMPQIFDVPGAGWLGAGGLTSYVVFALGWAVLGIACLRAGSVSTPAGIAMIVGGLVGYAAVAPPYGIALGAAVVWAGLATRTVRSGARHLEPVSTTR
jgi:hypothetical protein